MVYTEIVEKNGKKYYYRIKSIKIKGKVKRQKEYLGSNLTKKELSKKEKEIEIKFNPLKYILTIEQENKLKEISQNFKKEPKENKKNRYETFISKYTYDSNAIEGNTITLQETAQILFEDKVPAKSLREINEIKNHKEAIDYILDYKKSIDKKLILKLHEIIVKNIFKKELENQIGKYRTVQVFIRGVEWIPPESKHVSNEIATLLRWYTKNKNNLNPLVISAYFHSGFELVHPFVDGNGRVGRLLLNFILHINGFPMINIPNSEKSKYYKCLEKSQVERDLKPLVNFLYDLMIKEKVKY